MDLSFQSSATNKGSKELRCKNNWQAKHKGHSLGRGRKHSIPIVEKAFLLLGGLSSVWLNQRILRARPSISLKCSNWNCFPKATKQRVDRGREAQEPPALVGYTPPLYDPIILDRIAAFTPLKTFRHSQPLPESHVCLPFRGLQGL